MVTGSVVVPALDDDAKGIANQQSVDAQLVEELRERKIIGGQDDQPSALGLAGQELGNCHQL